MSNESIEWAKKFDWDKSANKSIEIFKPIHMKFSITIGIPAHNEEQNIGTYSDLLYKQSRRSFSDKE